MNYRTVIQDALDTSWGDKGGERSADQALDDVRQVLEQALNSPAIPDPDTPLWELIERLESLDAQAESAPWSGALDIRIKHKGWYQILATVSVPSSLSESEALSIASANANLIIEMRNGLTQIIEALRWYDKWQIAMGEAVNALMVVGDALMNLQEGDSRRVVRARWLEARDRAMNVFAGL